VKGVVIPDGWSLERLNRAHPRKEFRCGEKQVDDWLATKALQNQEKHLSATKVLLDKDLAVAGYYTLATGQVDFGDLPGELTKRLPRRLLPVAILAWLGVNLAHQGKGLGTVLLAKAIRDCCEASKTFAVVAVILDCISDDAKAFYLKWDFKELPGSPFRLFLSADKLDAMMEPS